MVDRSTAAAGRDQSLPGDREARKRVTSPTLSSRPFPVAGQVCQVETAALGLPAGLCPVYN